MTSKQQQITAPASFWQHHGAHLNLPVFLGSTLFLVVLILATTLNPGGTGRFFQSVQDGIISYGSWYYVMSVAIIVITVVLLGFSRLGSIKLGPDHSQPEYSYLSWFSMLFAAGMGIGLMFFGVAEPVMHFLTPPQGAPGTAEAASEAMRLTFFHWGIHAWSIYAIVALVLAYFAYRHDLPLTLKSAFYPFIGDRIHGPIGDAVDVFAIISTTCGVATSLGFGVAQINAGLGYLFGIPVNTEIQIVLILVTMGLASISVIAGLDVGIKRLSEINIILAITLLIAVLLVGPTILLLQMFMQNTGNYLSELVNKTFNLYAYNPTDWIGGWTIFYWGWWMSWSPFVGLFIARISRGRTIREFIIGALLVPTAFTLLWMTVFGNSAIELILHQGNAILADAVQKDQAIALFVFLDNFPLAHFLSVTAILMVVIFFVTSADSGAMVLNMLSSNGVDDTPVSRRLFWTSFIAITAIVLMLAGGLPALQTAAIAGALPFSVALLAAIWGLVKALHTDFAKRESMLVTTLTPYQPIQDSSGWQQRLRNMLRYPDHLAVLEFQENTVLPVLQQVCAEMRESGLQVAVIDDRKTPEGGIQLQVMHGDERDFSYAIRQRNLPLPQYIGNGNGDETGSEYVRAEVHLMEGGQDYDVMGWTPEQLTMDILDQYERHLHFLHRLR